MSNAPESDDDVAELRKALDDARAELQVARQRLLHAERMATLGTLAAGIAHEIKNPLNLVNNFAKLSGELVDELKQALASAPLDPEAQSALDTLAGNLERIQDHGARAERIIRTMLIHSRGGPAERRPTDINLLLDEVTRLAFQGMRAQDSAFNATVHADYDARLGMRMLAQESLTRAYLNVVTNAFYSLREMRRLGGTRVPELRVTTRLLEGGIEVRIRDNGVGIPKERLSRIFEPFFTTKPAGDGTGLGLSICRDILNEQGGTVRMESEEGAYAELITFIPAEQAKIA